MKELQMELEQVCSVNPMIYQPLIEMTQVNFGHFISQFLAFKLHDWILDNGGSYGCIGPRRLDWAQESNISKAGISALLLLVSCFSYLIFHCYVYAWISFYTRSFFKWIIECTTMLLSNSYYSMNFVNNKIKFV